MNRPVGLAGDIAPSQRLVRRPSIPLPVQLPNKRQVRKFVRGFGVSGDIAPRRQMVGSPAAPPRRVPGSAIGTPRPATPTSTRSAMPTRVAPAPPPRPASAARVAPVRSMSTITAAMPRPQVQLPAMPQIPTHMPSRRELRRAVRAPVIEKSSKKIWEFAQYPLIAIVALASAYSTTIGQWLVLVYGIMAIWQRWGSRQSFGIALFLLITIPLFQLIGQAGIAENVAVYVYELLVIGTIQALIELHKTNKMHN